MSGAAGGLGPCSRGRNMVSRRRLWRRKDGNGKVSEREQDRMQPAPMNTANKESDDNPESKESKEDEETFGEVMAFDAPEEGHGRRRRRKPASCRLNRSV